MQELERPEVTIEEGNPHATRRMNTQDAILMAEVLKPRAKNRKQFLRNRAKNKVARRQRRIQNQ